MAVCVIITLFQTTNTATVHQARVGHQIWKHGWMLRDGHCYQFNLNLNLILTIIDSKSNNFVSSSPEEGPKKTLKEDRTSMTSHTGPTARAPEIVIDEPPTKQRKANYQLAVNDKLLDIAVVGERSPRYYATLIQFMAESGFL